VYGTGTTGTVVGYGLLWREDGATGEVSTAELSDAELYGTGTTGMVTGLLCAEDGTTTVDSLGTTTVDEYAAGVVGAAGVVS
jgi:hypothetical protein